MRLLILNLQKTASYMKSKFLYDDVDINIADEIICNKCLCLDWRDSTKDKTALFVNQNDKYEKDNLKKTVKQLRKEKLHVKRKVDKQKICQ